MYTEKHSAWAVAAAIMVMSNRPWHYTDLTDRVLATELSDLGVVGVTPPQSLGAIMRSFPRIFAGGDGSGYYKLWNLNTALAEREVQAALAAIKKVNRPEQSRQPATHNAFHTNRRATPESQDVEKQRSKEEGWRLVREVLIALAKHENGISITRLNNVILQRHPAFLAANYGYASKKPFKAMLEDMKAKGLVELYGDRQLPLVRLWDSKVFRIR